MHSPDSFLNECRPCSQILLWSNLQRFNRAAFSDKVRAWRLTIKRLSRLIVYMVVDKKQIAAWTGRDVAARAMQGVTVEQHDTSGRAGGLSNTAPVHQFTDAGFIWDTKS